MTRTAYQSDLSARELLSSKPTGLKGTALIILLVGLIPLVIACVMIPALVAGLEKHPAPSGYTLAVIMGVFIVAGPVVLMGYAIQLARRRITFLISDYSLIIKIKGPFRRSTLSLAREDIRGISIPVAVSAANGKPFHQLAIHVSSRDIMLLAGAPVTDIETIAAILMRSLGEGPEPEREDPKDPLRAPPGCRIQMVDHGDGISFLIPSVGLKSGAGLVLAVGALYLMLLGCVALVFLISELFDAKPEHVNIFQAIEFLMYLALGVIWTATGFHLVRRRCAIVLTDDELVYRTIGPFRSSELQWKLADITAMAASRTIKDNHLMQQIRIHSVHSLKPTVILEDRNFGEIAWILARINIRIEAASRDNSARV